MKVNLTLFTLLLLLGPSISGLKANNIEVSNISLTGQNTSDKYMLVQFDLSWENSWRTSTAPGNWDDVWEFVKYHVGTGDWQQALLSNIVQIEKDLLVYKFSSFYKSKS